MEDDSLRIFLSSTFNEDIMRETRDAFQNEISARLNNIVGLLGRNAYLYDLQLGIPDGATALTTLETCFDKIRESNYFVFILSEKTGNRNTRAFLLGVEPGQEEGRAVDHSLYAASPYADTIRQGIEQGLYIIELEVLEAEKNIHLEGKRIFFFDAALQGAAGRAREIQLEIESTHAARDAIRSFARAEDIKRQFIDHFQSLLSEPIERLSEEERNRNLLYAGSLRYNVENTEGLALLDGYLAGDSRRVFVLQGPSGSGKSTLMADWLSRPKDPALRLAVCHAGAKGDTLREALLGFYRAHWPEYGEEMERETEQKLAGRFGAFLRACEADGRPFLLVIDGMNQLALEEGRGDRYAWLPPALPANVKMVVSTADEPSGEHLEVHQVPPVDLLRIIRHTLQAEGKELEFETIRDAVAASPLAQAQLPILARILCNEITANFKYDTIRSELGAYLHATPDVEALYRKFLGRLQERPGVGPQVGPVLAHLWCARDGLTLEDLCALASADVSELVYLLYNEFLRDTLGRLKFAHTPLAQAVEDVFCWSPDEVIACRDRIIDRCEQCYAEHPEVRFLAEIAFQLYELGDGGRMQALLSDLEVAYALYRHSTAWFALFFNAAAENRELPSIWEGYADDDDFGQLSFLAFYFAHAGQLQKSMDWRMEAYRLAREQYGDAHYETARTCNTIGLIWQRAKHYRNALQWHQDALSICLRGLGEGHGYTGMTCDELGKDYLGLQDFENARVWFERALSILEPTVGTGHLHTARTYNDLAILHGTLRNFADAELYQLKAVRAYEQANGTQLPNVENATGYLNLAQVYAARLDYAAARAWAAKAAPLFAACLGERHDNTVFARQCEREFAMLAGE